MADFADLAAPRQRVNRAQLTITVSPDVANYIETLADEYGLSKSAVVARIVEHDREKRDEALMIEGYREMGAR